MNGMRRILAAFVCAAMLVSLAACGASGTSAASATAVQEANGAYDVMAEASAEDAAEDVLQDGRKIVLNATLTLEALDFDSVCAALEQAAADAGGYASYSSVEGGSDNSRRYASYTFRIPADRYEEFLTAGRGCRKSHFPERVGGGYHGAVRGHRGAHFRTGDAARQPDGDAGAGAGC